MISRRSDCPVSCTLDVIGDRWTMLLLRDMILLRKSRFEEFLDSPERISTNVLTDRLHKMESAGLVEREQYGNHRYRFTYKVTARGASLARVLTELASWGRINIENTKSSEQIQAEMQERKNKTAS